jgi:hypothetical protein
VEELKNFRGGQFFFYIGIVGSIFKTTQLRGGQFILKTFGCKKKEKVKKTIKINK